MAAFSAGRPKASKPMGCSTLIALHPLVAGVDIRGRHGVPVADVEVAGGIGEHGEGVPLGAGVVVLDLVELILGPLLLPLFFDFLRLVPVCHQTLPKMIEVMRDLRVIVT